MGARVTTKVLFRVNSVMLIVYLMGSSMVGQLALQETIILFGLSVALTLNFFGGAADYNASAL